VRRHDAASCRSAIDEAATGLGGIDALVYAPGIGPLVKLVDTDADTWRRVFDTNVTGAALTTAAAVPYLAASTGAAVYLSSVSASPTPPWPGLGAYALSKAALDKLVEAWRAELPDIGFTRLVVGDCGGGEGDARTQINEGWDHDLVAEVVPTWVARQYLSGTVMDVERLVAVLVGHEQLRRLHQHACDRQQALLMCLIARSPARRDTRVRAACCHCAARRRHPGGRLCRGRAQRPRRRRRARA
jgi:NAD(P)-dependent dehydrogenase (short-subunit alcohol dehydrogenase family)